MLIVFGSINMDLNLNLKRFPDAGETVLSPSYTMTPGGKGANQAMAAARAGTAQPSSDPWERRESSRAGSIP